MDNLLFYIDLLYCAEFIILLVAIKCNWIACAHQCATYTLIYCYERVVCGLIWIFDEIHITQHVRDALAVYKQFSLAKHSQML